jgi:hypothetical protein
MELDLAEEDAFHVFWAKCFDEWENAFTEMVVKHPLNKETKFNISIRCNILIPINTLPFIVEKKITSDLLIHMGRKYWRQFVEGASHFLIHLLIKSRSHILEKRKIKINWPISFNDDHTPSEIRMYIIASL